LKCVGHSCGCVVGHGWHDTAGCCVGQKCDGHRYGAVVGHGWHDTAGCCVGQLKCVGHPSGVVVGHGWHDTAATLVGMQNSGACVGQPMFVGGGPHWPGSVVCGGCPHCAGKQLT
jgi:hypothetical protein